MKGLLTEPEFKTAAELHRLLAWLVTGQHVTASVRNGTA